MAVNVYNGTFVNGDLSGGYLTMNIYPLEMETPLFAVVNHPTFGEESQTFDVEKIDDNNFKINIGGDVAAGDWFIDLIYE